MGATNFEMTVKAKSAKEAFQLAKQMLREEYGNQGYTGTILEKDTYTEIWMNNPTKEEVRARINEAYNEEDNGTDRQICSKWGPAGVIKVAEGEYVLFGIASC